MLGRVLRRTAVFGCLLFSGCSHVIQLPQLDGETFAECVKSRGGVCAPTPGEKKATACAERPEAAANAMQQLAAAEDTKSRTGRQLRSASTVLGSPMHQKVHLLREQLKGTSQRSDRVSISLQDAREFLVSLQDSLVLDAWPQTASHAANAARSEAARQMTIQGTESNTGPADKCTNESAFLLAEAKSIYVNAYVRAYFRGGKFWRVAADKKTADEKLSAQIRKLLPSIDDKTLAAVLAYENRGLRLEGDKYVFFGQLGEDSFVSRFGQKAQFSGLDATFSPWSEKALSLSQPKLVDVAVDLVRIYFEATFDAIDGLPAVSAATGASDALPTSYRLQVFAKDNLRRRGQELTDEQLSAAVSEMDTAVSAVEGLSRAVTSAVVRGLNIAALNNETLAKIVEAAAGAAARKGAEKVVWCSVTCAGTPASEIPTSGRTLEFTVR